MANEYIPHYADFPPSVAKLPDNIEYLKNMYKSEKDPADNLFRILKRHSTEKDNNIWQSLADINSYIYNMARTSPNSQVVDLSTISSLIPSQHLNYVKDMANYEYMVDHLNYKSKELFNFGEIDKIPKEWMYYYILYLKAMISLYRAIFEIVKNTDFYQGGNIYITENEGSI